MTFHQLRIFWAVAHAKSFTKASKLLGLAQPSLSQQLTELRKAGIITPRRQHKHVFYSLSDPRVERVLALLAGKPVASTPARRDWPPMAPLSAAVFARVGPEAVQDRSEPAE